MYLLLILLHSQLAFSTDPEYYEDEYGWMDDSGSNLSLVKQPAILGPENLLLLDEKVFIHCHCLK